jgi:hypothetical protein
MKKYNERYEEAFAQMRARFEALIAKFRNKQI